MKELLKQFVVSKEAKRAYWTVANTLMALAVSFLVYLAENNATYAIVVLPFAQAGSQFLTKYINENYLS